MEKTMRLRAQHALARTAVALGLSIAMSSSTLVAEVSAYGRLPTYEDVTLSPDGTRIAFVTTVGEQRSVVIQSFTSPQDGHRIAAGDQKLRAVMWAGNDRILMIADDRISAEGYRGTFDMSTVHGYDLVKRRTEAPLQWIAGSQNAAVGFPIIRGSSAKPIVYLPGSSIGGKDPIMLYGIDFERHGGRVVHSSPTPFASWLVDADGVIVGESNYEQSKQTWSVRLKLGERWTQVQSETVSLDWPQILGFAPEDGWAIVRRMPGDNASL